MRGKQRKLQRCVRGSYDPLYRLSRNEHSVYSISAWVPASRLSQPGTVDVRIEREFNQLSKKTHGRGQASRHRGRLSCWKPGTALL